MIGDAPELLDYDDARLLSMARAGDLAAFGVLRQRHGEAARRLARCLVSSPAGIDDLVALAFGRVQETLEQGGGPADGFRPYLLTATRRVWASRAEAEGAATLGEQPASEPGKPSDPGRPFLDPATSVDKLLVVGVFLSLPERWSALLWHLEIEQESAAEIAPLFGLSFSGLTALERRARAAFRQTYLDTYSAQLDQASCMSVLDMMGGYLRYALGEGETNFVGAHLDECAQCRAVNAELSDLGATLRSAIAPVVLGGATAAYLQGADHEIPPHTAVDLVLPKAVQVWGIPARETGAGASAAGGAGGLQGIGLGGPGDGGAGVWGPPPPRDRAPARRTRVLLAVGAAALVALIGVPIALAMSGHKGKSNPDALAVAPGITARVPASGAATSPAAHHNKSAAAKKHSAHSPRTPARPTPTAGSTSSSAPSPAPTTTHPKPSPTPKRSPAPVAKLSATVDVYSGQSWGYVDFIVTNTGRAPTGALSATVTLPSGSSMASGRGHRHGWSCQPSSSGATCSAKALKAGTTASGGFGIQLSGTAACGQTVSLSVSSGSASASATSPETIQCTPGEAAYGGGSVQVASATQFQI